MKTLKFLSFCVLTISIVACGPSKNKMIKEISEKEKNLYTQNNPIPDKNKVDELIKLYKDFSEKFPKDSLAPEYLYKGATILMNIDRSEESIALLDKIISNYSNFPKLPEVVFLKAFIYENSLKNINKARECYTEFLKKFPNHDLANDAKITLDNLGKTPEQIVQEFEKRRQDSLAAANPKK